MNNNKIANATLFIELEIKTEFEDKTTIARLCLIDLNLNDQNNNHGMIIRSICENQFSEQDDTPSAHVIYSRCFDNVRCELLMNCSPHISVVQGQTIPALDFAKLYVT